MYLPIILEAKSVSQEGLTRGAPEVYRKLNERLTALLYGASPVSLIDDSD